MHFNDNYFKAYIRKSFLDIYIYNNKKIINSRDGKMYPPLKVNTFNQTLGLN